MLEDAKVTPNAAISEKDSIINQLRQNLSAIEAEKQKIVSEKESVLLNVAVLQHVPSNLKGLKPDEAISLMRADGYDFKREGDTVVATKNGEVVKTSTDLKPIPIGDVVSSYAKERGWIDEGQGQRQGQSRSNMFCA